MRFNPRDHDWLNSKATRLVLGALPKDSTRFVGGCVRNALLGEPVSDLDMATTLEPKAVMAALKDVGIAVHETGIDHGTITAVALNTVYEITTLRKDVSTDGRRATVAFTKDWVQDAQRRDFTINALYADGEGNIYDPTGQGLADIEHRSLRFVGKASLRIEEDYLRILRFFRFFAWYGNDGPMDADALKACREHKSELKSLSAERVWGETKKLLKAPLPHRTVNVMLINGILETILPEASNSEGLQLLCELEGKIDLTIDPYLRLMSMSARDELAMARLCKRLKMSNKEKTRLMYWAGDRTELLPGMDEQALDVAFYHAGQQVAVDRSLIRAAGCADPIARQGWLTVYTRAKDWQRPVFPLSGKDMMEAGVSSGPRIGKMLEALEALWVRSGFKADKKKLLMALALINR
jgi:poly(A) polymerase